jgi:glutamate-1-semialdehyde aminotransferase
MRHSPYFFFDEVMTGFRWGGVGSYCCIICFGKVIGGGLVGAFAEIMDYLNRACYKQEPYGNQWHVQSTMLQTLNNDPILTD